MAMLMNRSLIPVRIGALLVQANVVRADVLAQALQHARAAGVKVGEVLINYYHVNAVSFQGALDLQQLIKEGSLTADMATRALRAVHQHGKGLEQALTELGWEGNKRIKINDLAELLLDAGYISKGQIEQVSWNCAKNGLPLGRNLVLSGAISPSVLGAALNCLVLIRDGRITPKQAVSALRASIQQKIAIEAVLSLPAWVTPNHVRIGELLSASGILSESDAMNAVETGLLSQKPLGQVLEQSGMVSPLSLEAALKLQGMIVHEEISKTQAAELLRQVQAQGVPLDNFLAEMNSLKQQAVQLLIESELVSAAELEKYCQLYGTYKDNQARVLLASGLVSQDAFRQALRSLFAINNGAIDRQYAVSLLASMYGTRQDEICLEDTQQLPRQIISAGKTTPQADRQTEEDEEEGNAVCEQSA